jgi:hypothetical protein
MTTTEKPETAWERAWRMLRDNPNCVEDKSGGAVVILGARPSTKNPNPRQEIIGH